MKPKQTIEEQTDRQRYHIQVDVEPAYIPEQSAPALGRYVFSYTITIHNLGTVGAQLLSRHWQIKDAEDRLQEVHGEGVVGTQPHLSPGESFQYTSGVILDSAVGTMEGKYDMVADDGHEFSAEINTFVLTMPHTLH